MADLAAIPYRHAGVAATERPGSDGGSGRARSAAVTPFTDLLRTRLLSAPRLPPAADGLQVDRDAADRKNPWPAEGAADEVSRSSRRRMRARQAIDRSLEALTTPPVQREAERAHETPAETAVSERAETHAHPPAREGPGQRPRETHGGARGTRDGADPGEANAHLIPVAATPPAAAQIADEGGAQGLAPSLQSSAAPAPAAGVSIALLRGAQATAEAPSTIAVPGHAQAASIIREADTLHSQPLAALTPAAALAADSAHGPGPRQRAPSPTATITAAAGASAITAANEATTDLGTNGTLAAAITGRTADGPQGSPTANGIGLAVGSAAVAGAGFQAVPSQVEPGHTNASRSAATTTTIAAIGASTIKASPAATGAAEPRGPAGIGEGSAIAGTPMPLQTGRAAPAPSVTPPAPSIPNRMISDQVSVQIHKAIHDRADRIEIRLKPETLGRVEIRLELGADNRVIATVTAEQRQTLELLRADARSLERALQEAGLQTDGGSLNFNLRGGEDGSSGGRNARATASFVTEGESGIGNAAQDMPPAAAYRPNGRSEGIDIRA